MSHQKSVINDSDIPVTRIITPTAPKRWLVVYNSFSSSLWMLIFFSSLLLGLVIGQPTCYEKTAKFLTIIQSLAVVEVVNSAFGIVKAPLFTTTVQVASRLLIVYGIFWLLPESPATTHWAYTSLCLSWSITEIVRYSYYAQNLQTRGNAGLGLTWARYTLFFVLYPTGVASELYIIYLSLDEATKVVGPWYNYLLKAIMLTYIPGFYMLYTHMIKQRGKAIKEVQARLNKKTQ